MTFTDKQPANVSTIASILLSLGTNEEVTKRSKGVEVKAILPSFKQLVKSPSSEVKEEKPSPLAGRCSVCKYERFSCFKCRPDLWITCNDVIRSKYPHFNNPFTRGMPFEQHAADYIRHRRIKSFNLSRSPDYNAYIIPIELQNDYFYSFQQNFPMVGSTPFHSQGYPDHHKHNYAEVYPHHPGYKRPSEYAYYAANAYARKRMAMDHTDPRNLRVETGSFSGAPYPTPPAEKLDSTYPRQKTASPNKLSKTGSSKSDSTNEMDPTPRAQPVKSKSDQYTPRWVRYSGAKKEGLCDLCVPEKWLQLKDSAFWYHKQFFHGISSACGTPFQPPTAHRAVWEGNSNGTGVSVNLMAEGKCGQCKEWIPMFKNKKRFSHYFSSFKAAKEDFLASNPEIVVPCEVISEVPLKIVAARDEVDRAFIPDSIPVSQALANEIDEYRNGKMGGVWWRHAHKCHVYTPE
jgi:hypothetical protein